MKKIIKSLRTWGLCILPLAVLAWLFRTDPDNGASTRDMLVGVAAGFLAVTLAYLGRKFVMPYLKLDEFVKAAKESPTGAGLVALGAMIFMSALLFVFSPRAHAADVRTYIPAGAFIYAPILKAEQARLWPDHYAPEMLGALVEQESCISLTHSRCWNPASKLKTAREEGAGFGQITRAYAADGSLRFDSLEATKGLDSSLAEWSWSNVYLRPDLQLRAIVVMGRDCDRRMRRLVADPQARLDFCDAAYNGGYGGMQSERRACGQRAGCNPQKWFAAVDAVCLKSKVKWKGYGQSACEINRGHVEMVSHVRRGKYVPLMVRV